MTIFPLAKPISRLVLIGFLCLGCGAGAEDTGTIRPVDRATPPEDPGDTATAEEEHPLFPREPGMEEPSTAETADDDLGAEPSID